MRMFLLLVRFQSKTEARLISLQIQILRATKWQGDFRQFLQLPRANPKSKRLTKGTLWLEPLPEKEPNKIVWPNCRPQVRMQAWVAFQIRPALKRSDINQPHRLTDEIFWTFIRVRCRHPRPLNWIEMEGVGEVHPNLTKSSSNKSSQTTQS